MGKLSFIYGVMGSAKTANALMQYFELKQQGKNVIIMKPSFATRDGSNIIKSRVGLECNAEIFTERDNLKGLYKIKNLKFIIIDECQFCTEEQIDTLKRLSIDRDISIYCYGLKLDFTSHLCDGSKRLIELADETRQLEMSCFKCGKQAEINALLDDNNNIIKKGHFKDINCIGAKYKPLCFKCWDNLNKLD